MSFFDKSSPGQGPTPKSTGFSERADPSGPHAQAGASSQAGPTKPGEAPADNAEQSAGPSEDAARAASARSQRGRRPWYAGRQQDMLFYLLVAVVFLELIVGVVAFFYGLMNAAPLTPGGPPMARFPWLGWGLGAVLAPVGLLLLVHLTGSWLAHFMKQERAEQPGPDADAVPERLQRFYAMVRNAPTVVVLVGILLLGAGLFFVDGALSALLSLSGALLPYIPWIVGSLAALLGVCYLGRLWLVYRQRRLDQEYAFRREVLERTGIVLVDKGCVPLTQNEDQRRALALGVTVRENRALPPVLDVESPPNPSGSAEAAGSAELPQSTNSAKP